MAEWIDDLQWPAMLATIAASWLVGSTQAARRRIGFWTFLASNAAWGVWAWHTASWALLLLQAALAAMNVRAMRKAAAEARNSAKAPG